MTDKNWNAGMEKELADKAEKMMPKSEKGLEASK